MPGFELLDVVADQLTVWLNTCLSGIGYSITDTMIKISRTNTSHQVTAPLISLAVISAMPKNGF